MENRGYSNATNAVLYKAVKVLMLSWKDSAQKEFKQQLQRLSTEFKAHNFDVEEYDIESKRSHLRLSLRLSEFLNYDDDDTLLIIYYSGHGQDDQDKNNLWLRDDPSTALFSKNPHANWSSLQDLFLNDCSSHVLFLLDCSFGTACVRYTDSTSTVEAIVASATVAPLRGKDSFTMFLRDTLKECRELNEGPIYAARLCTKIQSMLFLTEWRGKDRQSSRASPSHHVFSNAPASISIGVLLKKTKSDETSDIPAPTLAPENEETLDPLPFRGLVNGKDVNLWRMACIFSRLISQYTATPPRPQMPVVPRKLVEHKTSQLQSSRKKEVKGEPVYNSGCKSIEKEPILFYKVSPEVEFVWDVAFSSDAKLGAFAHERTIVLWDAKTGALRHKIRAHSNRIWALAFSPDNSLIASGSGDGYIGLWDTATGQKRKMINTHSSWVKGVAFSPDGKLLASSSFQGAIKLWDYSTGALKREFRAHSQCSNGVVFSLDGTLVASASTDKTVKLWDPATGKVQNILKGHSKSVSDVAFSHDDKVLASASNDTTVRLWNVSTGTLRRVCAGHTGIVASVAFSPDDTVIASASYDHTVKLWDPNTGAALYTLKDHTSTVWGIAFSPDGKMMASGSFDSTIMLYKFSATGEAAAETPDRTRRRNKKKKDEAWTYTAHEAFESIGPPSPPPILHGGFFTESFSARTASSPAPYQHPFSADVPEDFYSDSDEEEEEEEEEQSFLQAEMRMPISS